MELIKRKSWVKNKIIFFIIMFTAFTLYSGDKYVSALSVEDIRAEIKCPDHDRPEILSLIGTMVKEGKTKDEIMDAVGDNFGEEVFTVTREMGSKPYVIPAIIFIISLFFVVAYIKKWIIKGEKTNLHDKEIVDASTGITDYKKRFDEEYKIFKKED